jgi:hypothetical protein
MGETGKWLVLIGGLIVAIGLLWPWLGKIPWGRLPGDIVIERDNARFYFPITTTLIISVVVSIILAIFRR